MNDTDPKKIAEQVNQEFERVVQGLLQQKPSPGVKHFRFALGLFALSIFCLGVAVFPWQQDSYYQRAMWVFYSFALLCVGWWQIEKSLEGTFSKWADEKGSRAASASSSNNVRSINRQS